MDQFFLKFNYEQFDDSYTKHELRYSCDEYDDFVCIRKNNEQQYLARQYKKGILNDERFAELKKIKLYNVLPVFDLYNNQKILVTSDFEQFNLQNNLESMTEEQKIYLSAVLSITLQELAFRGFPMLVNERSVIILENHICLQLIDFSFDRRISEDESFESFTILMNKLFSDFREKNFNASTNYFLEKNQVYLGPSENMPFVELLDQIFEFSNVVTLSISASNSYVYEFDTPDFMKTIPNIQSRTVLKSIKLDMGDVDQDYILTSSQRELEIMENFKKYEPLVSCYAYFRVQKQLYIFMERYPQVLSNILDQIDNERHCIELCCQLAVALRHLHKHQIIHRDLKPGNLFLSNEDLDRAQLLIADFDRSRLSQWLTQSIEVSQQQIKSGSNSQLNSITAKTILGATPTYDPPEAGTTDYDTRADIWQVGMIFFQIANRGTYPVEMTSQNYSHEQYKIWFTLEKIQEKLLPFNVDSKFIEIIAKCLSYEKENRPTSEELVELLKQCFDDHVIHEDDENLQSTHNMGQMGRFSQLKQKTKTLKMLNSQDL